MHAQQQVTGRALKLQEVLNLLSISKSYHFAKLDSNSKTYDPTYPRPVRIGERSVRYMEHEVLEWLEKRMEERNAQ